MNMNNDINMNMDKDIDMNMDMNIVKYKDVVEDVDNDKDVVNHIPVWDTYNISV